MAQDARDKAARKHCQVGEELEALRLLLDAKAQAWREATLALERAQQEADTWAARLRREQEQVSAVAMPMHVMCAGTPQHLAAGLPPEVAKQFQSWLGTVSPDAIGRHLWENGEGTDVDLDVHLDSTLAAPVSLASAPSAFAPFRATAQKACRDRGREDGRGDRLGAGRRNRA